MSIHRVKDLRKALQELDDEMLVGVFTEDEEIAGENAGMRILSIEEVLKVSGTISRIDGALWIEVDSAEKSEDSVDVALIEILIG